MVGTRSRSRRQERAQAPQETHQNFDNTDQGYPTRRSEAAPVQFAALPSPLKSPSRNIKKTPSHSSSLRAARRVLNVPLPRNRDIEILALQHCTSGPSSEDLVCENPVKVAPPPASNEDLHGNYQSSRENHGVSHVEDIIPVKSTTNYVGRSSQCLSTSLNITEFARRQHDDTDDDPDEVQSALDPAFDCVNGHKVKKENAPLLRAIFEKYGDITRESEGKPPTIVSFFLERLCVVYERLKGTKFSSITRKDLNEMLDEVRFLESQKLNLMWLHEKLEYIYKTKTSFQNYLTAKEEEGKSNAIIGSLENELEVHKRAISLIEEKLVAEKVKADQIKKIALDIKARVDDLRTHSLVHGLL